METIVNEVQDVLKQVYAAQTDVFSLPAQHVGFYAVKRLISAINSDGADGSNGVNGCGKSVSG